MKQPIDDEFVSSVAAEASVYPVSVIRRLAGLPVRGLAGVRVDRVLKARGVRLVAPVVVEQDGGQ